MLAATARIDLRNLAGRKKFLEGKDVEKALNQTALVVIDKLRRNWTRGIGGDDKRFEAYTLQYLRRKQKAGRRSGHVDLIWDGDLHRSISFKKLSRLRRIIRPLGAKNIVKMKGLTTQRNGVRDNIMLLSDRMQDIIVKIVFGKLKKARDASAVRTK